MPYYIAHVARDEKREAWREPHDLAAHLRETAKLAEQFAERYGAGWARLAGQWHDLGKYRLRFQRYIRHKSGYEPDASIKGELGRAPHSTAGALLACDRFGLPGRVLAYLIAGHHAGLDDWYGGLCERLADPASRAELMETLAEPIPPEITESGDFKPDLKEVPGKIAGFPLWVRLLFSALVDADFLDTERYMSPDTFAARNCWPSLSELAPRFDAFMARKSREVAPTSVNAVRAEVLQQCRDAAQQPPGIFSLTVPTGGGKTLSSMAFALGHALRHGKRRIVYAIPYTSIIEQTARVYRDVFGEDAIVEHHSNVADLPERETSASRLASENWDAPIIVTTNVQLFESLFADRPSRCRKLHNLVDSIIVLDEAHLLSPQFLQPILDVMNLLVEHYGVTFVLSTATQPVLASRQAFDPRKNVRGLDGVREIVSDPDGLYERLDRVQVHLPADWNARRDWSELAQELARHSSVLAIVNTRAHARALWQAMPEGTLHLSALMCPAHRSVVIGQIKKRLGEGIPTRVVSTQLVEAGVDLDFPVVYRAIAGLDSIAQAAGRCNREGKLVKGEVIVFVPPQSAPPGLLRKGEDACRKVLYGIEGNRNPLERSLFAAYFTQFYSDCDLDEKGIGRMLATGRELDVRFRSAAEAFRLIDDEETSSVVVRYRGEDGTDCRIDELLALLELDGPQRWLLRKLQPYMVMLYRKDVDRLLGKGDLREVAPGVFVQESDWLYHPILGFDLQDGMDTNPAMTIV
ncbi:CRISPR-associated endonuclease Cas3'' [Tepidiphilus margaritifer]|uniref:CRISPR-associated endonuclease Cas3'' n=1 Tax=Tepidiphilus margaritifer TaxID=203471 RepID=UPI0004075769|nr:CRISPR-associated endonuclease Cas3'' [Tepidiphilus margaritifer]